MTAQALPPRMSGRPPASSRLREAQGHGHGAQERHDRDRGRRGAGRALRALARHHVQVGGGRRGAAVQVPQDGHGSAALARLAAGLDQARHRVLRGGPLAAARGGLALGVCRHVRGVDAVRLRHAAHALAAAGAAAAALHSRLALAGLGADAASGHSGAAALRSHALLGGAVVADPCVVVPVIHRAHARSPVVGLGADSLRAGQDALHRASGAGADKAARAVVLAVVDGAGGVSSQVGLALARPAVEALLARLGRGRVAVTIGIHSAGADARGARGGRAALHAVRVVGAAVADRARVVALAALAHQLVRGPLVLVAAGVASAAVVAVLGGGDALLGALLVAPRTLRAVLDGDRVGCGVHGLSKANAVAANGHVIRNHQVGLAIARLLQDGANILGGRVGAEAQKGKEEESGLHGGLGSGL
mmetsp:Transcript_9263/g.25481  ORF Transcript_9263/g.25481 Transcript_9263/m.25481 type:complete len:420 (-) Transcript_9263:16-1275(-)